MQIDKQQIIQFLQSQGKNDQANQASTQLPDQVDTDQHQDLLHSLGIDPQQLIGVLTQQGGVQGIAGKLGL